MGFARQIQGPGDVLSLTSFWIREHYSTAISLTHVKAMILDEKTLSDCLGHHPRVMRRWTNSYRILHPVFEACLHQFESAHMKKEDHDKIVEAVIQKAQSRFFI